MSFVIAAPEFVTAAASDVANIGSTISAANAAAAGPTTAVIPAAADEVSAAITSLFNAHAQGFQAFSAQAAAFHDQFVQLMNAGAGQYAAAEAANASPLQTVRQDLLNVVNAPTEALLGRPLIGNGGNAGAVATTGTGGAGGTVELLLGASGMNNSAQAAAFHAPLLQPLNAIAGSFTSATAAASQGPLVDLLNGVQVQFNAVQVQLQDAFESFLSALVAPILTPIRTPIVTPIVDAVVGAIINAFIQSLVSPKG
jgi:hypothetical protein